MDYSRLPDEIKAYPCFAVSGASKAPMGIGANGKLRLISVNEPSARMTFAQAVAVRDANVNLVTHATKKDGTVEQRTGLDIGFILSDLDPFTVIDLDVKDATTHPHNPELWTTPEDFRAATNIYEKFNSFTEWSRSGKGLHVWVRGDIGAGFRKGCIEIYSRDRYMICTGKVFLDRPIVENQPLLGVLVSEMRPLPTFTKLVEEEELEADWYILKTALEASNGDKFRDLYDGKWVGYESQSEADLALMSMLAFYSRSNEQCRRMFRKSGLGRRDKAIKNNVYLNRTLTVIRGRIAAAERADIQAVLLAHKTRMDLIAKLQHGEAPTDSRLFENSASMSTPLLTTGSPPVDQQPEAALVNMIPTNDQPPANGELEWPPGGLGQVARFIYANSYLPIREVSIVAALGLAGGLCGRAWNIPQSGLNIYVVLVARSAIGKEAMHTGISTLMSAATEQEPSVAPVADFTEYASGPALMKAVLREPCFVNVLGEWGRKLQRMSKDDGGDAAMQTLRTAMTNLYQKSGMTSTVGGLGYSNKEDNVESMYGVAYSMIGETTPTTFYESLTEDMMADGFLSRFTIVNYEGDRPPTRTTPIQHTPDPSLVSMITNIRVHAMEQQTTVGRVNAIPVKALPEAANAVAQFEEFTSQMIRATAVESERQIWNRASLKVQRIAALLAVFDGWYEPRITLAHFEWAKELVRRDVTHMLEKLKGGSIGTTDNTRELRLKEVCREYLDPNYTPAVSYGVITKMRQNSIVTRDYLSRKTNAHSSFYKHQRGHAAVLTTTIQTLIDDGVLMHVKDGVGLEQYGFAGKCYRILSVK
jgi:hypothetical protein